MQKRRNLAAELSEAEVLDYDRPWIGLGIGSRQCKETEKSRHGTLRSEVRDSERFGKDLDMGAEQGIESLLEAQNSSRGAFRTRSPSS